MSKCLQRDPTGGCCTRPDAIRARAITGWHHERCKYYCTRNRDGEGDVMRVYVCMYVCVYVCECDVINVRYWRSMTKARQQIGRNGEAEREPQA
jgi:hypothetical protein